MIITNENIKIIKTELEKGNKLQLEYDKKNDRLKLLICKLKVLNDVSHNE